MKKKQMVGKHNIKCSDSSTDVMSPVRIGGTIDSQPK